MATMKALIAERSLLTRIPNMILGKSLTSGVAVRDVPKPKIDANQILVKVHTTALNPIDFKFIDFIAPSGSKLGCDFAGVVAEVGSTSASTWKVGDRVAGFVQCGIDSEFGSFAEYVKAEKDLVWRIPEGVSDADASTFGVAAVTAMQALHLHLDIPWPVSDGSVPESKTVFIYAGSSAVGLFAIQLAKAAGCTVVTTCSPHSFDLVKSYGADAAYNYRDKDAVEQIRNSYPNITKALDCISEGPSTDFAARVIGSNGGTVITTLTGKSKTAGVEAKMIMSFQMLGRPFQWLPPVGPKFPVSQREREGLVKFYAELPQHIQKIKAPPVTLLQGGFDGVLEGLQRYRQGKVSGKKLVVAW